MRSATLLLAVLPLCARAQDAGALADRMLQQLDSVAWNAPYQGGNSCRQYSGALYGEPLGALWDWSWHCDRTSAEVMTESYYYAFSAAPVLLRLDIGLSTAVQGSSAAVRQLLEAKLTQRLGAPEPGRLSLGYPQPGDPFARISRWRSKAAYLLLFDGPFYVSPLRPLAGVRLIAIASPLDDRIHEDAKISTVNAYGLSDETKKPLKRELGALYDGSTPTVDGVVRLLGAAQTAQGNRKAAMLFAADGMISGLSALLGDGEHVKEADAAGRQLVTFGVKLGPQRKDDLEYDHQLLWEAWQKYPFTEWGEYSFLTLQQSGWDPSADGYSRPENPDRFRDVVEHGEAFLPRHPNSPFRLQVLFAVTTAYETWWSVSLAPASDEIYGRYPRRAENDRRRETARLKAIAGYEQIQKLAPDSDYALFAARHLPRLRLRLDTGLRRWFEPGD